MPHIALNSAEPGIRGLLRYRPETARPLSELTDVLLRLITQGYVAPSADPGHEG